MISGFLATNLLQTTNYVIFNLIYMFGTLIVAGVNVIAGWRLFSKAGYAGWLWIIPIVNIYVLFKMAFGEGKSWIFILLIMPVIVLFVQMALPILPFFIILWPTAIISLIIYIIMLFKLAQAFNKGVAFGFGLLFLEPIFILILAFGDAEYYGAW